ncbi:ferredoxin [Candidatus Woesearchaeota archaeon]|nr:ferredoxin [Candidatus Woesearchaeota archaeon]
MAKYKIEHDRPGCIGCGACARACPENWEMAKDGKSKCKKTSISQEEYKCNKKAADGCPVNVIHIKDDKGKKII